MRLTYWRKQNAIYVPRYLLILIIFCSPCTLLGQSKDVSKKQIQYLFQKYSDLPPQSDDTKVFWDYIMICNNDYYGYLADNSNLAKKAKQEFYERQTKEQTEYKMNEIEKSLAFTLCGGNFKKYIGGIIYDSLDLSHDIYAYIDKTIYLSKGMGYFAGSYPKLLGILAHEVSHCALNHIELHLYNQKKKERSNNTKSILAQIFTGMAVGGAMVAHGSNATFTEETGQQYNKILTNSLVAIEAGFNSNTVKHRYKYSRMQEVEADIVACLFLQWIGEDPLSFVSTLDALKSYYDKQGINTDDDTTFSSHPSLNFRIETLMDYLHSAYLYFNPDIGEYKIVPLWNEYAFEKEQQEYKKASRKILKSFIAQNRVYRSSNNYVIINENEKDNFINERCVQILMPKKTQDLYSFY